jgi:putative PEP-CTERM system histidine kinase
MIAALVLWGHALAALAFALLAIGQAGQRRGHWARGTLIAALAMTSLWALTVAGLDVRDVAVPISASLRNLAWFALMGLVARRQAGAGIALASVYAVAIGMTVAAVTLALVATLPIDAAGIVAIDHARYACRMMEGIAGLVLVHNLHIHADADAHTRGLTQPIVLGLTIVWGWDVAIAAAGYFVGAVPTVLLASRGFALATAAAFFGLAARMGGNRSLSVSRSATIRLIGFVAFAGYAAGTVLLTILAGQAGNYARIAQTAIVFGSATALMTLLTTPWLRAWSRVMLAKHLFDHRYDYRTEWQRFTTTLGMPGPHADPLDRRIIRAIADLTDSTAGLLLAAHPQGLEAVCGWHWEGEGGSDPALIRYLENTARIVELDAIREGAASDEEIAAVPAWMLQREEAWVIVPLIHHATLVGAILLARPPVDRALDWEDLDLLRIVGRQAASYLAEGQAHGALAEARRFDEFNRRFAFILHDIKNLVSGLTLVARNAERHADNPAFRADMIATLKDSVARMNALLAKLSQHHQAPAEQPQPIDLAALAERIAGARRAQHPIQCRGHATALAQPGRLDQLLGHLIQNAVEASASDAPVVIAIRQEGMSAMIDIIDTGTGMSAAFVRDHLFRPFASSKPTGFGIGAYEARQLARGMGGDIAVESREGEGTRFTVMLPAAPAMEVAA